MINIIANDISQVITNGKVVLEVYSSGCLNCQIMSPILSNLEKDFPGISFCQINADITPDLIQKYKIMSLPTLLIFRHGQLLRTITGVKHPQLLKTIIGQTLNYPNNIG